MTRLTLVLILLASPAFACVGCETPHPPPPVVVTPPPVTPPPVEPPPPVQMPDSPDSDPYIRTPQPVWMPCARRDGVILYHVEAWMRLLYGYDEAERRTIEYCTGLPPNAIPQAKTWGAK